MNPFKGILIGLGIILGAALLAFGCYELFGVIRFYMMIPLALVSWIILGGYLEDGASDGEGYFLAFFISCIIWGIGTGFFFLVRPAAYAGFYRPDADTAVTTVLGRHLSLQYLTKMKLISRAQTHIPNGPLSAGTQEWFYRFTGPQHVDTCVGVYYGPNGVWRDRYSHPCPLSAKY